MEKLTEKLNAISISKATKESLIRISEKEQIQIQQVCRRLLRSAIEAYDKSGSKKQ
jgi:hypothetical protein